MADTGRHVSDVMVEGDQELDQYFVENYFYTEYGHKDVGRPTNLILKVFLEGLYDEDCPLSRLRGCHHLLSKIWAEVRRYWVAAIQLPDRELCWQFGSPSMPGPASRTYAASVSSIDPDPYPVFPEPSGININMKPFIVGGTFEECKLPYYVLPYWDLIRHPSLHPP